ncbi:MAG TPA: hypothetical protein VJM11_07115 [Nevskiaceae bacterium]|nr:hypothetical protein [Nevskiaceae bacterium]
MRSETDWYGARYIGQPEGHYESWFLRANHPTQRLAFWIRYTIFSPRGNPDAAIGELWAIVSDGERNLVRAAKSEVPIKQCDFATVGLNVRIGQATLVPGDAQGAIESPHRIGWDLHYDGGGARIPFLPLAYYAKKLPKAKSVTTRPFVRFSGTITIDGESLSVDDWIGSENHNWGSKHTDAYAWGQVVGFDDTPDAFLELITARLKLGPLWTPPLTIVTLRVGAEEIRLNTIRQAFRAKGRRDGWRWLFDSAADGVRVHGVVEAAQHDFVGLTYRNPPGGDHLCLNSKIAACRVTLERPFRPPLVMTTAGRAAFEILTDDRSTGVPIVA